MPLHIGHVDAQIDVQSAPTTLTSPAEAANEHDLLRHLRPVVLKILEEELARLRRAAG